MSTPIGQGINRAAQFGMGAFGSIKGIASLPAVVNGTLKATSGIGGLAGKALPFLSGGLQLGQGALAFARGDQANGTADTVAGAWNVGRNVASKLNPALFAANLGVNVGETVVKGLNMFGLDAPTDVGKVMGQATYAIGKMGVDKFAGALTQGLMNDERIYSNNGLQRAAGYGARAVGHTFNAVGQVGGAVAGAVGNVGKGIGDAVGGAGKVAGDIGKNVFGFFGIK